jgi:hypothetical protein
MDKEFRLIAEAYISSRQKDHNEPTDIEHDTTPVEVTDDEGKDAGVIVMDLGEEPEEEGCECEESPEEHESEELEMAKTNLFDLFTNAKELHDILSSGESIEPWMLQKIAVASSAICDVAKRARYHAAAKGI